MDGIVTIQAATPQVAVALIGDPDAFLDVLDTMAAQPVAAMAQQAAKVADRLIGQGSERDIPVFLRLLAERIEARFAADLRPREMLKGAA